MTPQEFVTSSPEETVACGRKLSSELKPPVLVLLSGELGAGKTTLAKGIIAGLGAAREEDITSPTFTLVHEFSGSGSRVYHVDLYRIEGPKDLESLGLADLLSRPAVVLVEWPEHLVFRTDWPLVQVRLEQAADDSRRIRICTHPPRG